MKKIELIFEEEKLEGILIKEDKTHYTVKLSSGYNAVLDKKECKDVSLSEQSSKAQKHKSSKDKSDSSLPKIVIIHTGGTIASKVDYATGAVSSKFKPEELLDLYPELKNKVEIKAKMIGNLFSEDMRFAHYNLILEEINAAIKEKPIGIIVSHGTDTMHYTSAALQYSCENLSLPVILVGAQRSSDRPSSDAYTNLDTAVDFLLKNSNLKDESYNRVGILMHSSINDGEYIILDGINAKKMHSTRRDAFKQINYEPFAYLLEGGLLINRTDLLSGKPKGKFKFTKYDDKLKVGFFKAHPNLFPEEIKALSIYDTIIIEGTGLGHLGINEVDSNTIIHKNNLKEIKALSKKIPIIMGVQTVYGETNMNVYSTGRYLIDAGIIGNHLNLTTETLFIRAAYCLSKDKKNFEKLWKQNLEGFEIRSVDVEEE
jgi:glutamyl-tRNA(Gln) amidotransferase subunit D